MFKIVTRSTNDSRLLRVGDIVEIRPLAEIVATLDDAGRLDGMPFMPEMAASCGQRATVVKRAHKTCDGHGHLRWLDDTVHLDGLHCDGSAHGGCQAGCLTFWKTPWLKRVADNGCEAPTRGAADDDGDLLARAGPHSAGGYGRHGALHLSGDGSERREQAVTGHRAEAVHLGRVLWELLALER